MTSKRKNSQDILTGVGNPPPGKLPRCRRRVANASSLRSWPVNRWVGKRTRRKIAHTKTNSPTVQNPRARKPRRRRSSTALCEHTGPASLARGNFSCSNRLSLKPQHTEVPNEEELAEEANETGVVKLCPVFLSQYSQRGREQQATPARNESTTCCSDNSRHLTTLPRLSRQCQVIQNHRCTPSTRRVSEGRKTTTKRRRPGTTQPASNQQQNLQQLAIDPARVSGRIRKKEPATVLKHLALSDSQEFAPTPFRNQNASTDSSPRRTEPNFQ